jgi:hypothetical protein
MLPLHAAEATDAMASILHQATGIYFGQFGS